MKRRVLGALAKYDKGVSYLTKENAATLYLKAREISVEMAEANVVRCILQFISFNSSNSHSVFLWAIERGHLDVVKYIDSYMKNIGLETDYNFALEYAARYNRLELVNHFMKYDTRASRALYFASCNGQIDMVKHLLLNNWCTLPAIKEGALRGASRNGHLEVVKFLVAAGTNLHSPPNFINPLALAAEHNHINVVKYLVFAGAQADYSALVGAATAGNIKIVKFLSKFGFSHYLLESACYYAAKNGHLEIVKYFVEKYMDMDRLNHYVLFAAVRSGNIATIEYLVNKGMNVRAENNYAICVAANCGYLGLIKYLISKGAEIDKNQGTALRFAIQGGKLKAVKYLVEYGVNIDACNDYYTLTIAIGYGYIEVIKYLVEVGVDPRIIYHFATMTPFDEYNSHIVSDKTSM